MLLMQGKHHQKKCQAEKKEQAGLSHCRAAFPPCIALFEELTNPKANSAV